MSKNLAVLGGKPVFTGAYRSDWPISGDVEIQHLREVLESSMWSRYPGGKQAGGSADKVARLEKEFSEFLGVENCMTVTNGTAALELACRALLLEPGDEIITPAYSFVSSATCVFAGRAIPVFVDLDPETFCISPDRIEEAVTDRTRAIVAVHLDGYMCDMDRIMEIAKRHNLYVIEDCARAPGSEWRGRKAGAIGHFGCFSFWNSKHMSCGEGGLLSSTDEELFSRAASIANQGRRKGSGFYEHALWGRNERMGQFQAAVLLGQMSRLPDQIAKREENMAYLEGLLEGIPGFRHVCRDPRATQWTYYFATFHYDSAEFGGVSHKTFCDAIAAEGIPLQPKPNTPLSKNELFSPEGLRESKLEFLYKDADCVIDYGALRFPVVEGNTMVTRQHRTLLGPKAEMDAFAEVVRKLQAHKDELREYSETRSK